MVHFLHLLLIVTFVAVPVDGFSSSPIPNSSFISLGYPKFVRRRKASTALNSSESLQQHSSSGTLNSDNDSSSSSSSVVGRVIDYSHMTILPRHPSNNEANAILTRAELALQSMQAQIIHDAQVTAATVPNPLHSGFDVELVDIEQEAVYANSYVDMGAVDTVGFDYDYTLVTYTNTLLELIYDMALRRLVEEKEYPREMLEVGLKFDPSFSIRGLAVDRENGWICHLSYTHKVAVAWEGRNRVSRSRLVAEYSGKRALSPSQRRLRLKPLNDLFSMAECCLMADTVQFFLDRNIRFCPRSAVTDVLGSITGTHVSGQFHKMVAQEPEKYFEPQPYLSDVLDKLKGSGKRLIFVSNSPFWYCDAGMNFVVGPGWRDQWDVVITSAGKPDFYTENNRPFREVDIVTGKAKFKQVSKFEEGHVYTSGCLKELTQLINWRYPLSFTESDDDDSPYNDIYSPLTSPTVMYVGDSLFADLVDAKREFGWTTAAVTPEVGWETELQRKTEFIIADKAIEMLLSTLRLYQRSLGTDLRSKDDMEVMDKMERIVSWFRDEQTRLLGNPFGSVFRARYTPSLFAHSLRRYSDLYMSNVGSLRHYSPQHRFYPEPPRLLSHEIRGSNPDCWDDAILFPPS